MQHHVHERLARAMLSFDGARALTDEAERKGLELAGLLAAHGIVRLDEWHENELKRRLAEAHLSSLAQRIGHQDLNGPEEFEAYATDPVQSAFAAHALRWWRWW